MSEAEHDQWDESKRENNLRKHGVDFDQITDFDWDTAFTREDSRINYGEVRSVSIGFIAKRLHVAVWTERRNGRRLISLRKANEREIEFYDTA